jgi:hypothetical protein
MTAKRRQRPNAWMKMMMMMMMMMTCIETLVFEII